MSTAALHETPVAPGPGGPCAEGEVAACCPGMGFFEDQDSLDTAIESLRVMGMAYRRFFHTALGENHPGLEDEAGEARLAVGSRALSPQEFMVMTQLSGKKEFAPSDLARMLAVARPNMAALLKSLRERELINMESSSEDKRRQIVTITAAGQNLVTRVMGQHREHLRALFSGLDARELLEMEAMAKRMTSLMGKLDPVPIGRSRTP